METGENCWDLQGGVNQETETMVNLFPAFVSSHWEIPRFHNFMATSIFFLQIPWTLISMSLCLFVEVRPDAWEILEISAISASYSHIRVVRTIWIRTHTDARRYTGTLAHTCTHGLSSSRMDATHLSVDGAQVTKWVPGRTSHLADDCPCICASIQICISVLPLPCIWSARRSKWSHRAIESAVEHTWSWWNFLLPVACDSCDPQIEFYINFIFNISSK